MKTGSDLRRRRLVGRVGKSDLGFLNMQTISLKKLHSENFVPALPPANVERECHIGGIFTNRMDFGGNYNTVQGLDGIISTIGDEYITARWAQFRKRETQRPVFPRSYRIYLNWERRRYDGFSYNVSLSKAEKDYSQAWDLS